MLALGVSSQTKLPAFFNDNMVLQQNDSVNIWGSDLPNTKIELEASWGKQAHTITDKKGKWKLKIKTPKASYINHTINIKGSSNLSLKNVLIGEVWLASGQSNMEMKMKGFTNSPIRGANEFILNSNNKNIRLFTVERHASFVPEKNVTGNWQIANPKSVAYFSALAYLFAKKIHQHLNVPVGIIATSWGGTKIKVWMPEETLKKFDFINLESKKSETDIAQRQTPAALFNGMIHPILGYNIKGFLWYQGETDRFEPNYYKELFPEMVKSWRNLWNLHHDLPFYYVQIAPFDYQKKDNRKKPNGALLREAQLLSLSKIPNSEMVITSDIGEKDNIHPAEKESIANRLAYIALHKNYGFKSINYKNPIYTKFEIKQDTIEVFFDEITMKNGNGLVSKSKTIENFFIAGEDQVFYPANAIITKNRTIKVFSKRVLKPKAVRYGFTNYFKGTLFNTFYLPLSSFRTDNWNID